MTAPANRNAVDLYYMAQGKLNRQFRRLLTKPVSKWKDEDIAALGPARTERNAQLERLTGEQFQKVFGDASAKRRQEHRDSVNRMEALIADSADSVGLTS